MSLWKSSFIIAPRVEEAAHHVSGPGAALASRAPGHMAAVVHHLYPLYAQPLRDCVENAEGGM